MGFPVRKNLGDEDYGIVCVNPFDKWMQVLEENMDALYMYLNCLLDSIFECKKATTEGRGITSHISDLLVRDAKE